MLTYYPKRLRKTAAAYDAKIAACYVDYHHEREVREYMDVGWGVPTTHQHPPGKYLVYEMLNRWRGRGAPAA